MTHSNEINDISNLSDLLFEILLRCQNGSGDFDERFNDLVSLILTGEQLREQLSNYNGSYVFVLAKADLDLYEGYLACVPVSLYGALRDDLEVAVPVCDDDKEEFRFLRRGLQVIRENLIANSVEKLSR